MHGVHERIGDGIGQKVEGEGIHIQWKKQVKALGVGLAAGVRRNAVVAKERLAKYAGRMRKYRKLRRAGVSTARLVRIGLTAMTYGSAMLGVPCGMLRSQRQTVAAVAAPGAGTGGQNLDLALMVADGSAKGRDDPGFDAHIMPIGQWAMALWECWE